MTIQMNKRYVSTEQIVDILDYAKSVGCSYYRISVRLGLNPIAPSHMRSGKMKCTSRQLDVMKRIIVKYETDFDNGVEDIEYIKNSYFDIQTEVC